MRSQAIRVAPTLPCTSVRAEVASLEPRGSGACVVDAEQVQHRRIEVVDVPDYSTMLCSSRRWRRSEAGFTRHRPSRS